jgi:hypothetical protein
MLASSSFQLTPWQHNQDLYSDFLRLGAKAQFFNFIYLFIAILTSPRKQALWELLHIVSEKIITFTFHYP